MLVAYFIAHGKDLFQVKELAFAYMLAFHRSIHFGQRPLFAGCGVPQKELRHYMPG